MSEQLSFDITDMIRQSTLDHAAPWNGAPLGYTEDYYTPDELAAASARYDLEHGFATHVQKQMWHPALATDVITALAHSLHVLIAYQGSANRYQVNCVRCRWHTIAGDENAVVEAWHDHAMPGWRALPIAPEALSARLSDHTAKSRKVTRTWVLDNHPDDWQFDGCPVLTRRSPMGTRHVPSRSPLGGYDLCANDLVTTVREDAEHD